PTTSTPRRRHQWLLILACTAYLHHLFSPITTLNSNSSLLPCSHPLRVPRLILSRLLPPLHATEELIMAPCHPVGLAMLRIEGPFGQMQTACPVPLQHLYQKSNPVLKWLARRAEEAFFQVCQGGRLSLFPMG